MTSIDDLESHYKWVQEILHSNENLLRVLIDNLPDLIYMKDKAGCFTTANKATAFMLGVDSPEALIGKTISDFYPPEIAAQRHQDDQTIIQSGQAMVDKEERLPNPIGQAIWYATTKVPIYDDQGKINGLVGVSRDINQRKQSQKELEEAYNQLQQETAERENLVKKTRHLLAEIQALSTRISAVNEIATAINQSLHLNEILDVVGNQAKWLLDFDHSSICIQHESGDWELTVFSGEVDPFDITKLEPRTPLSRALKTGYPQLVHEKQETPFLGEYSAQIIIPLKIDNQVKGTINFASFTPNAYNQEDLRIGYLLALQINAAIRNAYSFATLNRLYAELEEAKHESEMLLRNVLPKSIAEELKKTDSIKPIYYHNATVMFTDFKGFTTISDTMSPQKLVNELDYCFTYFDHVVEKYNLEKLKTIGDAYMCVGGIPVPDENHALNAVSAALEMQDFMIQAHKQKQARGEPFWDIRIGIHSGPLVAGVIGRKKFSYDVWGSTVNLASRLESSGVPGEINISKATYALIKHKFNCQYRGEIEVKNMGKAAMYLVKHPL